MEDELSSQPDPTSAGVNEANDSAVEQTSLLGTPTSNESSLTDGSQSGGLWRIRADGQPRMDATCGRVSSLGLGDPHLASVFERASEEYLGDANRRDRYEQEPELAKSLWRLFSDLNENHAAAPMKLGAIHVASSADQAMEAAIWAARCRGEANRFRVMTLTGSDHGRTTLCRTLSGRPTFQQGFGPMVPGIVHCPAGDMTALRAVLDETVAAVVLCPVDLNDGCQRLDPDFLQDVAELCQQQSIELILDETQCCFGASGKPFVHQHLSEITVDTVVLSAGLFGGVGGGVVLSRFQPDLENTGGNSGQGFDAVEVSAGLQAEDSAESVNPSRPEASSLEREPRTYEQEAVRFFPGTILQGRLAAATLERLDELGAWETGAADGLAEDLAHAIGGFEFVREMNATGTIIGMETDLPAAELCRSAERQGLIVEAAGENAICLQLPVLALQGRDQDGSDWSECVEKLRTALEAIERRTVEL